MSRQATETSIPYMRKRRWRRTLVEDMVGVRISGNYDRNDPTFDNLIAGIPSPNGGKSYSGRIMLRAKPTDRLEILLKAYGSRDKLTQGALHSIGATPTGVNPITGYSRGRARLLRGGIWPCRTTQDELLRVSG